MRYKIELAYNGKNYHGWQKQQNAISVQQRIEDAINLIFNDNINIVGCGRTDTGVHAKYYVAHFDSEKKYASWEVYKLNNYLDYDINIISISEISSDFNARFSALERRYNYYISTSKNPFMKGYAWYLPTELNINLMQQAMNCLYNYTDFSSFSKSRTDVKTNNCKILNVAIEQKDDILVFDISADRFLRNMVRAIVGTLVEVGREQISVDDFCKIIESKDRRNAGQSVPAEGLYLIDVKY